MTRHLKICHTSDWHLGHTLHGHSREYEHQRFLAFLLDALVEEHADALIVAGDVFDTGNPSAAAQTLFYGFLADARARLPHLDILVIAGNHDSPARLSAPDPILRAQNIRVVGSVNRTLDRSTLVAPLHDRGGEVAAWVAAVPFLRPSDLPIETSHDPDAVVQGVREVYRSVLAAARTQQKSGQALIATGHCHMVDARPSELSERAIAGALPLDIFDADVAYAALGHLHYPQFVGREHVRYSGSPIPLAMAEESYPHQMRIVRFENGRLAAQEELRVPRTVDVLRLPREGPEELDAVLAQLARIEVPVGLVREAQPFLEVRVRLREPMPDVRQRIEAAIGERVRLVKIAVEVQGRAAPLAESAPRRELGDLDPEEVFRRCYERAFDGAPNDSLLAAFREIVDTARGEP
jgi:exonuclease SbcD